MLYEPMFQIFSVLRSFAREKRAFAAAEFALLAPVLGFSLLGMIDVAQAISARMDMDQSLRAGAHMAMANPSELSKIEGVVYAAYGSSKSEEQAKNTSFGSYGLDVNVTQTCTCSSGPSACNTLCSDDEIPSRYIDMSAERFVKSILLPDMELSSNVRIQVR